jgi:hypothetical protein
MDRDEAIRLLKSGAGGVKKWNEWRKRSRDRITPNLRDADLSGADLRDADLSGTILWDADLCCADLVGASLWAANLQGASINMADLRAANLGTANLGATLLHKTDLCEANLFLARLEFTDLGDANLYDANLDEADIFNSSLGGADLRRANLRRAIVHGSYLRGADLAEACVGETTWADVDLSQVKGLETLRHTAPSTIGIDTLLKSGDLPDEFLLGCGVPETILPYIRSLHNYIQPIQFYSCFISYSHKDEEFARRLHGRLRQDGLRIWYAPEDMKGGKKLHHQIDEAIRLYDRLLLVLSEASMDSEWVKTEIYKARQREIREKRQVLFPIRLVDFERIRDWECFDADTGKDLAREVREYFIPDFSDWKNHDKFEAGFARLLADLKKSAEPVPREKS